MSCKKMKFLLPWVAFHVGVFGHDGPCETRFFLKLALRTAELLGAHALIWGHADSTVLALGQADG
jgi:hypothetical protein